MTQATTTSDPIGRSNSQRNYARGPVIDRYRHGKMSYKIDYFCARAFPIVFAAFNIAYWSYYLSRKE